MGEGTLPLRVAIRVKHAWNNTDKSSCSKNAPPYLGHFLSNFTMNIPSTMAANIARFSVATSPTKSKQRAKNAPFRSPIAHFSIALEGTTIKISVSVFKNLRSVALKQWCFK